MFNLGSSNRYHLYKGHADMRCGIDGLSGLVRNKLKRNPVSGEVFVFINRNRTRIKLLHWVATGFVLYYHRLEKGTLEMPEGDGEGQQLTWSELMMIVEGIKLKHIEKRVRFSDKKRA